MTAVERYEPTGLPAVDRAVAYWRHASMLPAQFKDKTGAVKLGDLALAAIWLSELGMPPVANLPGVYVVAGRVGLMADLQRALVARDGWDLEVVDTSDQRAVVRIGRGGEWKPAVTVTYEETKRAGWTTRNPNYQTIPDRMLLARACSKAVSMYAPGALRGIPAADAAAAGYQSSGVGEGLGEVSDPTPDNLHPLATAPDGTTIPAARRESEADQATRDYLADHLATDSALEQTVRQRALEIDPHFPNIRSRRFTKVHAALLDRLIAETWRTLTGEGYVPAPVPEDVRDDDPEQYGRDVDASYRYDPADMADDPGRPL